jgi:Fe-S cluster biogenesis protein NfuA
VTANNVDPPQHQSTFEENVRAVLQSLLPRMRADGGGAEIVSFAPGTVTLKLIGVCLFCPSRPLTAKSIESILKNRVPGLDRVEIVYPELRGAKSFVSLG